MLSAFADLSRAVGPPQIFCIIIAFPSSVFVEVLTATAAAAARRSARSIRSKANNTKPLNRHGS